MSIFYNSNCLFKDDSGYVYSCDNIRLKGYLIDDEQCEKAFHDYFDNPIHINVSDVVTNISLGHYRYLWNIICARTSITVLYWFNGYDNSYDNKRVVVIEFNPNKLMYEDFMQIDCILCNLKNIEVVRCDLAVDIPLPRDSVYLIKDNRNYQKCDYSDNGVTEYLGTRNSTNFIKLYDKTKESNLDSAVTRLEITCLPYVDAFESVFPQVIIKADQLILDAYMYDDLNSTQILLIDVLRELPISSRINYLKRLNKPLRKKLKPYIFYDTCNLKFDYDCVRGVFNWITRCVYHRSFLNYG